MVKTVTVYRYDTWTQYVDGDGVSSTKRLLPWKTRPWFPGQWPGFSHTSYCDWHYAGGISHRFDRLVWR